MESSKGVLVKGFHRSSMLNYTWRLRHATSFETSPVVWYLFCEVQEIRQIINKHKYKHFKKIKTKINKNRSRLKKKRCFSSVTQPYRQQKAEGQEIRNVRTDCLCLCPQTKETQKDTPKMRNISCYKLNIVQTSIFC